MESHFLEEGRMPSVGNGMRISPQVCRNLKFQRVIGSIKKKKDRKKS